MANHPTEHRGCFSIDTCASYLCAHWPELRLYVALDHEEHACWLATPERYYYCTFMQHGNAYGSTSEVLAIGAAHCYQIIIYNELGIL